jgi:hypothetical protein
VDPETLVRTLKHRRKWVTRSKAEDASLIRRILPPVLVFAFAVFVYSQYGLSAELGGTNGIALYSGQRMAEGIPHYVSIFDIITPLGPMLAGVGVMISKQLGWSDIYTVRLLFFFLGCCAVVSVYLLGNGLFRSQRVGAFAALTFLGFFGFAQEIARGPYHKVPMVLFGVLSLFFTSQRRWFLAGLCGSLSFLLWQPTVIFLLVTLFLATMQPRDTRPATIVRALLGTGIPLVAVGAYFFHHNAFYRLLDGSFLFHILYGDRGEVTLDSSYLLSHFSAPVQVAFASYTTMIPVILVGLVVVVYTVFSRWARHRSFRDVLVQDPFAPILLSLPAFVLWSLIDFANYKDFFVFLPYAAIGFGWFLDLAVRRIGRLKGAALPNRTQRFLTMGLCISLVVLALANESIGTIDTKMEDRRQEFDQERQAATEIEDRFGNDAKLIFLGAPELLALQHRTNPTPYAFFVRGIDNHIDANTPGGFKGWLRELEAYDPEVIVRGSKIHGSHKRELMQWLNSNYREERIGPWRLYVKNSIDE